MVIFEYQLGYKLGLVFLDIAQLPCAHIRYVYLRRGSFQYIRIALLCLFVCLNLLGNIVSFIRLSQFHEFVFEGVDITLVSQL